MFNRGSLSSKCKAYAKFAQTIKNNLACGKQSLTNGSYKELFKTIGISAKHMELCNGLQTTKNKVLNPNEAVKFWRMLCTSQANFTEKLLARRNKEHKDSNKKLNWNSAAVLSAAGLHIVDKAPPDATKVVEAIPEPPPLPDVTGEVVNALGESSFVSLGLGGWSPVGLVQHSFEYLHVTLGIPWWEAILIDYLCRKARYFHPEFVQELQGLGRAFTVPESIKNL